MGAVRVRVRELHPGLFTPLLRVGKDLLNYIIHPETTEHGLDQVKDVESAQALIEEMLQWNDPPCVGWSIKCHLCPLPDKDGSRT